MGHSFWKKMIVAVAVTAAAQFAASAGSLEVGSPNVSGGNVRVPIVMGGDTGAGVSAMDFTLTYDPAVLQPVRVTAGASASSVDKGVQFNVKEPGQCTVVVVGLNQNTMPAGEVATMTFQRVGTAAGTSDIAIVNPTFSDPNAAAIPATGGTGTINLGGDSQNTQDPANGDSGTKPPADEPAADPNTGNDVNGGGSTVVDGTTTDTGVSPGLDNTVVGGAAGATAAPATPGAVPGRGLVAGMLPTGPGTGAPNAKQPGPGLTQLAQAGAGAATLPQGVQPGQKPGAGVAAQPGTPGTQPETAPGTPGAADPAATTPAPDTPVAAGVAGTVAALATPTAATGQAPVTAPAEEADIPGNGKPVLPWVPIIAVLVGIVGLAALFLVRRRLFG